METLGILLIALTVTPFIFVIMFLLSLCVTHPDDVEEPAVD